MSETKKDRRQPETASRQVAAALRSAIGDGSLAPGDRLPSERTLASTHGVARNTAREAVRQLAESGLVTAEHGRGVFVRVAPRLMRFGQLRYSKKLREDTGVSPFHAEVLAQNRIPNAYLTSIERAVPPASVADRLGVKVSSKSVVRRENWYFADGEPMQVGLTYIPWEIAKGTVLARSDELGPGDLYARFADRGYEITYTREEVTARMPTPEEATGLMLPDGVPVLVVLHTGLDQQRRPFEVTEFVMRADYTGLDYTMPVDAS
ncbi:GntR family transcriptional regulator [Segeticoccus rhizosphaerae]|uniref:GntR family transcriptional regulator n=1 Tax=Segeticoccus rhizosphaerae TaxID=1104777 RepID=UPI0012646342|nr:GntR family transcriptional regulator [Segeticoccus rhizosphaerae]